MNPAILLMTPTDLAQLADLAQMLFEMACTDMEHDVFGALVRDVTAELDLRRYQP